MNKINRIALGALCGVVVIVGSLWSIADRGLPQKSQAEALLKSQGYTQVRLTGWDWAAGDSLLDKSTGFQAVNPYGIPCRGAVVVGRDGRSKIRFWD